LTNLIDALQTSISTNQALVRSFTSRTDDFASDLKSVAAHVSAAEGRGQDVSAIREAVIELTNSNFQLGNQVRGELSAQDDPLPLVNQIASLHKSEMKELQSKLARETKEKLRKQGEEFATKTQVTDKRISDLEYELAAEKERKHDPQSTTLGE
jgi:hypothetical protein